MSKSPLDEALDELQYWQDRTAPAPEPVLPPTQQHTPGKPFGWPWLWRETP
jgi:hypothetical protein